MKIQDKITQLEKRTKLLESMSGEEWDSYKLKAAYMHSRFIELLESYEHIDDLTSQAAFRHGIDELLEQAADKNHNGLKIVENNVEKKTENSVE